MNNSHACSLTRLTPARISATHCTPQTHKRLCSRKRHFRLISLRELKGNEVRIGPGTETNLGCWRNAGKPQRRTRWQPGRLQPSASIWYRPTRSGSLLRKRSRPGLKWLSNDYCRKEVFYQPWLCGESAPTSGKTALQRERTNIDIWQRLLETFG